MKATGLTVRPPAPIRRPGCMSMGLRASHRWSEEKRQQIWNFAGCSARNRVPHRLVADSPLLPHSNKHGAAAVDVVMDDDAVLFRMNLPEGFLQTRCGLMPAETARRVERMQSLRLQKSWSLPSLGGRLVQWQGFAN